MRGERRDGSIALVVFLRHHGFLALGWVYHPMKELVGGKGTGQRCGRPGWLACFSGVSYWKCEAIILTQLYCFYQNCVYQTSSPRDLAWLPSSLLFLVSEAPGPW